jgi:hypothetical protein
MTALIKVKHMVVGLIVSSHERKETKSKLFLEGTKIIIKIIPKKNHNQNNTHYIEVDQYYTTKTKKLIYIYNIITTYTI